MNSSPKLIGPDRQFERWRWQIFGITWLAYAGYYLTRKSFWMAKIELVKPEVMGLTTTDLTWIDVGNQTAYALGQFVLGMCGDRFGARKVVLLGMFGSIVAAVAMGMSTSAVLMGVFFGIQGLCQSSGWAPLAKNVSAFFSQRERGTVMGMWCTNYAIGGLVASPLAGHFGQKYGWPYAFYAPAVLLALVWIIFWIGQRNRPEDVGLSSIEKYHGDTEPVLLTGVDTAGSPHGRWRVVMEVLRSPMVLLLAGVYFFLKPTRYAIFAWSPLYLNERLGTGMAQTGLLSALFELAGPISVLAGGIVSDRLFQSRRMPVSIFCLVVVAVILFTFDKLPATRLALGTCLFLIGLFLYAPDSLVSGTAAVDFGTKQGASTAAGIINGAGSIGAILGVGIPGLLQKRFGWDGVFMSLAVTILVAALLLLPKWNALPAAEQK